jgi:hypothetical protein
MSGRVRVIIIVIVIFILLSITSFLLLAKFCPPLNRKLFGGEFEISLDDIQFWVKKVPQRNYYRVYARYQKSPKTVMWWGHSVFFADSKRILGFDAIFFNPEDNKIYGGGSEKEKGWEWTFYYLGEGKIPEEVFKPLFLEGTKFTFNQLGSLEFASPPGDHIKIYFPGTLKKLEKEDLEKGILAEIVEDVTRAKK